MLILSYLREANQAKPELERQVRETLEQGSLAGAIAADQRQPVSFADVKIEVTKQPAFALDQSQIFVRKDRRGHPGP